MNNRSNLHAFVIVGQERESESRRLRRETDADRQGLEGARQACLERERGLSAMEERLRERGLEADDTEVRWFLWGVDGTTRYRGGSGGARSCPAPLASCCDMIRSTTVSMFSLPHGGKSFSHTGCILQMLRLPHVFPVFGMECCGFSFETCTQ